MKKKIMIGLGLVLVVGLLITITIIKSNSNGVFARGKSVEVKATESTIQDIKATVPVNGVVEEVEKEEIYFDTPIKVTNLFIEKNQTIKKGQKLIEFDMDDLYSQLEQAKVNLNVQKISFAKVKDSLRLQNTSQLQSSFDQAKMLLDQAKTNLDRVTKLYSQGAASLIELENAKSQYNSTLTQYSIAESNLNDANKNNDDLTLNNSRDIENQKEQIRGTELRIQELQSKINKLNNQKTSPMDGVITELNIEKGSTTSPAVMAIKIINSNKVQVNLEVKEVDILKVKPGQNVEITGDAFVGKTIYGAVKDIGAVAKKKQGMSNSDEAFIEVIVSIDDKENILKPGISVNAKIVTEEKKNAIVIPFDAFQEDKDGNKWVFAIENNIAKQKNITSGIGSEMNLEVINGLIGNEKLVQDPPSRLKDGMKIIVQNGDKK